MSVTVGCKPNNQRFLPFGNNTPSGFRNIKVLESIENIPTPLIPDSVYFVRHGAFVDMIVVDDSGTTYLSFSKRNWTNSGINTSFRHCRFVSRYARIKFRFGKMHFLWCRQIRSKRNWI